MASVNAAAVRAADTLLRGIGGTQVLLRTPAPANPDDDGEQLGLSTPLFQDFPLLSRGLSAGTTEVQYANEHTHAV